MKRKCASAVEFQPRKEPRRSNQRYLVVGLRGTQLRLCPIKHHQNIDRLPKLHKRDIVRVEVQDQMRLCEIPIVHGGLVVGEQLLGTGSDEWTTVRKMRKKMRSMAGHQLNGDRTAIELTRNLLPIFKELWQSDEYFSDNSRTITLYWELDTGEASATLNLYGCLRHGFLELEWLGKAQVNLLVGFQEYQKNGPRHELVQPSTIEITYDRNREIRWLSITVTTRQGWNLTRHAYRTHMTRLDIEKKREGDLEWRFTRGNPLPFMTLATELHGKGSWDRPFRPLMDSFVFDSTEPHLYLGKEKRPCPGVPSLLLLCMAKIRQGSVPFLPVSKAFQQSALIRMEEPSLPPCLYDMILFGRNDIERVPDPSDDDQKSPPVPSAE